jgi:hypothetical protein
MNSINCLERKLVKILRAISYSASSIQRTSKLLLIKNKSKSQKNKDKLELVYEEIKEIKKFEEPEYCFIL